MAQSSPPHPRRALIVEDEIFFAINLEADMHALGFDICDPPGADNGGQPTPPLVQHKGVIEPPPIGDEDIYTQAPNPHAGHEEEVIPPPGTPGGDPSVEPR